MLQVILTTLLALTVCIAQHGFLATWPIAPDLPLALAVWLIVDGTDAGVLLRAWLVGVVRDLVDPGSTYFHAVAYLALALAFLPVRSWFFHARTLTWAGTAGVASLVLAEFDRLLTGGNDGGQIVIIAVALLTAIAAPLFGVTFSKMPRMLNPAGKGGA